MENLHQDDGAEQMPKNLEILPDDAEIIGHFEVGEDKYIETSRGIKFWQVLRQNITEEHFLDFIKVRQKMVLDWVAQYREEISASWKQHAKELCEKYGLTDENYRLRYKTMKNNVKKVQIYMTAKGKTYKEMYSELKKRYKNVKFVQKKEKDTEL